MKFFLPKNLPLAIFFASILSFPRIPFAQAPSGSDGALLKDIYFPVEISPAQIQEIEAGQILYLGKKQKALGGVAAAMVAAPAWKVWQVITDFPEYPHFMPRNLKGEVLKVENRTLFLKSVYRAGFAFPNIWNESRIEQFIENPRDLILIWRAEKTNLEFNRGFWNLKAHGQGTMVIYHNAFDIPFVPIFLAAPGAKTSLLKTLAAVRERVKHVRYEQKPGEIAWVWRPVEKGEAP